MLPRCNLTVTLKVCVVRTVFTSCPGHVRLVGSGALPLFHDGLITTWDLAAGALEVRLDYFWAATSGEPGFCARWSHAMYRSSAGAFYGPFLLFFSVPYSRRYSLYTVHLRD